MESRLQPGGRAVMKLAELSYASDKQPLLKRAVIRTVEGMSGRRRYGERYLWWRKEVVPAGERVFQTLLSLAEITLVLRGNWPPQLNAGKPLVIVANHPYGIGDGIAVLSMAEALNRPFRVLVHSDLLKVPELTPYALGVDFSDTKEALKGNLEMRREALRLLRQGTTMVIFPAGGVATAASVVGKADDLPWKLFTAKLIRDAGADVLPVFFDGQNSLAFHAASRLSVTLRLALLVREFRRLAGKTIIARVGDVMRSEELATFQDRVALIRFLRALVFAMEPQKPAIQRKSFNPLPRLAALSRRSPRMAWSRWPKLRSPRQSQAAP